MFQKNSFSIPSDSSGILLVKVIQTRRCSTRKHADIGKFLRVVLKNTKVKLGIKYVIQNLKFLKNLDQKK